MSMVNQNFNNLENNYLFAEVAKQVQIYKEANPDKEVISLGIGDVTLPLAEAVVSAIKSAADDMAHKDTFKGYGPYEGYGGLRDSVAAYYAERGVTLGSDEIFIGDGAKNDLGSILDLFSQGLVAAIPDPVYPAYVDVTAITGNKIVYVDANEQNGFLPAPPSNDADLIYLCSPNNPTGAVYNRDELQAWVDYANAHGAVILFDAAYESFIKDASLPRSIFEIEGARTCAIELCSFSKTAGFTGVRCGYTVIPKELERDGMNLNSMWARRIAVKYNGTSYIIQKAAEAALSAEGRRQIMANIDYYMNNAKTIAETMRSLGIRFVGGDNSPYIWFKCPDNMGSWEMFHLLLNGANIVCTPGAGFGKNGEGWVRLTSFGTAANTKTAMERIKNVLLNIG